MPSRLYFEDADFLRCRFAVSPLWETQDAVRTLKRPDRHGYHAPWLRRIRRAAAELDLTPLWLLMPRRGHSPDWLGSPPLGPAATFEEEIAAVRAADPEAARADTARSLADTPGALESPYGRAWLADPERMVRELAVAMEQAWHVLVEPDWPRLRALLEADVAFHSRRLAEVGLGGLLPELSRRFGWHAGTLTVESAGEYERHLGGQGLVLMPSVFSWPDVVTGFEPPWQPALVYPARGIGGLWSEPADRAPDTLVRLLGRGRAAVLTALDEPSTTTALAHRLGLASSSVSAHLTVLRDSGLLTSRRYGHQVLYERTPLGIMLASSE
ncbi:ArsR/SmtB family transcription factor [Streptomyces sp. HUAS TT20]|uniref:ArsR/SmtB family transcription factor n=1 Tax=Streptomyces sp. HUAS TT20 TaxID=3447509 RepID=UPI0021D9543C|nr:winged helix-turn-helix domain-containing protein [Streptomyces sp. HUAS 15-9]UXY30004.1 winged helix-turn-helix domain-containing protein [Streptomyces sp. HUAS 15-9]